MSAKEMSGSMRVKALLRACSPMLAAAVAVMLALPAAMACAPKPPGQPTQGYGSGERYICSSYKRLEKGSFTLGTKVTVFVPSVLKNGSTAPVVIYLHGFMMVAPDIYLAHIRHLTNQGYIVVFPSYNLGGFTGMLRDTDQTKMMERAVRNANTGLAMVAGKADLSDVTIFGHSLGGLLGACWQASGGVRPRAVVLANLATDATAGMPSFVKGLISIKTLDWKRLAPGTTAKAMVLTGTDDKLSGPAQARDLYGYLTGASSRVLYCLQTDKHGDPDLMADHNACISDDGWMPDFIMDLVLGGDGEVDATDWRFYWAALDAALDGRGALTFDMGCWSDGAPVAPVLQLAP